MISNNNRDFQNPKVDSRTSSIDMNLRQSHFAIGDLCSQSKDHYQSTYDKVNTLKEIPKSNLKENISFKSSYSLGNKDKFNFATESQAK